MHQKRIQSKFYIILKVLTSHTQLWKGKTMNLPGIVLKCSSTIDICLF